MVRVLFNGFKTLVQILLATLFYFFKYFVETTSENDIFTHLKIIIYNYYYLEFKKVIKFEFIRLNMYSSEH